MFFKAETCIVGPNDNVMMPKNSTSTDWEVELGIVIGRKASYVDKKDALKYVAGYCLINDVSERDFQLKKGASQWSKGKGCDTFGPIGPWMVTKDEIKDVQNLDMWLDVNGEKRQRGNTKTMIFGVAELVADVSQYMTLLPGDVITTGTPPGVGHGHEAAAVAEGRRRRHARHQGAGRAEAEGCRVQGTQVDPIARIPDDSRPGARPPTAMHRHGDRKIAVIVSGASP